MQMLSDRLVDQPWKSAAPPAPPANGSAYTKGGGV